MNKRKSYILFFTGLAFGAFFYVLSQWLFSSYYRETWGLSAQSMHSPPFGVYYPKRVLQVGLVSALVGFIVGCWAAGRWQRGRPEASKTTPP